MPNNSDNHTPPTPDEMGPELDEEIKETVHDWANDPDKSSLGDLAQQINDNLRGTIGGWVNAEEGADWKTIGEKMDANTRSAIGGWVGAEEDADWSTISGMMDARVRRGIARLVRVEGAGAEGEPVSWAEIGTKIESDMRGWVAAAVGTEKDADWQTIGKRISEQVSTAFDKLSKSMKKEDGDETVQSRTEKIEIEGEDGAPSVTSSEPVDES